MPAPIWVTEPVPLITFENVTSSERLKANTPLPSTTLPVLTSTARLPLVPPSPSCNMPPVIRTRPPIKAELSPVRTVVPAIWSIAPLPLIAARTVVPFVVLKLKELFVAFCELSKTIRSTLRLPEACAASPARPPTPTSPVAPVEAFPRICKEEPFMLPPSER